MNGDAQNPASACATNVQAQIPDIPMREKLNSPNDFAWLPLDCEHAECKINNHHRHCRKSTYEIEGQNLKHAVFISASVDYAAVPIISIDRLGWTPSAVVDRIICDPTKHMNYKGYLARKTFNNCTKEKELELAKREAEHMENLRHPHVVLLVGTYEQSPSFSILMYPAAKVNLEETLRKLSREVRQLRGNQLPNGRKHQILHEVRELRRMFGCLIQGLKYLHKNKKRVKHLDLKPSNILIDQFGKIIIADLGSCHTYDPSQLTTTDGPLRQTYEYSSPEAAMKGHRSHATDIFSIACTFLEMMTLLVGETVENFTAFRAGKSRGDSDYTAGHIEEMYRNAESLRQFWYSRQLDQVYLWIDMLKGMVERNESLWDMTSEDPRSYTKALDMIRRMLSRNPTLHMGDRINGEATFGATTQEPDYQRDTERPSIDEVWSAFQEFTTDHTICEDCDPRSYRRWSEDEFEGTSRDYNYRRNASSVETHLASTLVDDHSDQSHSHNSSLAALEVTLSSTRNQSQIERGLGDSTNSSLQLGLPNQGFDEWLRARPASSKIMALDEVKSKFVRLKKSEIESKFDPSSI